MRGWLAFVTSLAVATGFVVPSAVQVDNRVVCRAKKDDWKEDQMRAQREILSRRKSKDGMRGYASEVSERRKAANAAVEKWAFQRDSSADPLIAWKKMRGDGTIGDLKTGLGTDGEKREGGIPIPLPSFGVGGEAGVGGQYDNGERFDLRLPYVDQGYVDEDADVMKKLTNFFGGGDKKKKDDAKQQPTANKDDTAFKWPWEQ